MRYDDNLLVCKSADPFYRWEESGAKPSTIRVVPTDELLSIGRCTHIRVEATDPGATLAFERDITGIFDITPAMRASGVRGVYGKHYVNICWQHPTGEARQA